MARVYVMKPSTGAVWSSVMPKSGVWRKESLGTKFTKTCQVGAITQGFHPFSRKNRNRFQLLERG